MTNVDNELTHDQIMRTVLIATGEGLLAINVNAVAEPVTIIHGNMASNSFGHLLACSTNLYRALYTVKKMLEAQVIIFENNNMDAAADAQSETVALIQNTLTIAKIGHENFSKLVQK